MFEFRGLCSKQFWLLNVLLHGGSVSELPETYYVFRATAFYRPATKNGNRGPAIGTYSSRIRVPPKEKGGADHDLGIIRMQ
ncbi:MAG: hypothetical protein ACI9HK_003112 [Pirellulaceae bacterium]|jgi:hypothetical protein